MDIVVKGRNVEVPEHFRTHVADKLARSERYDPKIIRVDVELSHESNRRLSKTCQRVQITLASRGPAVRAEASAETFYSALDAAVVKLESRLRRSADIRHHKQHARTPISVVAGPGGGLIEDAPPESSEDLDRWQDDQLGDTSDGGPGRVVRIKDHPAEPITVDQALFQMELVGHDFYLFKDADSGLCSVVYRRKGFDYGLLRLT
ncbi:ribosome hibernation-promoting factor, HPF/YfiA family [Nakamurella sp. PAMC28650]|uniref:ribosome hibernation-promoting factor, HPF/YfiA family n=1 Tax=Nakamurella sp. PAMC28650 TaxID=2762325 RepID=UPI00164E4E47|nr:ribosome-associated translation inhibitor RaiA [Nakamurella sp. PAMC28650]QNK80836.1 ribosome-associated translation inhibitor RaiA [Nakamurella sp. PAMC28650]